VGRQTRVKKVTFVTAAARRALDAAQVPSLCPGKLVKLDGQISLFPSGKSQALWDIGVSVFMELGLGRQLPPGPAGGKTVVSARG